MDGIQTVDASGRTLWTSDLRARRVAIAEDASWIAAAAVTEAAFLDPATGARSGAFVTGSEPRGLLQLGELLVAADAGGSVAAWGLAERTAPKQRHREAAPGIACACADGARVVLGCTDGTVCAWTPGAKVTRLGALKHPQQVSGVATAPGLVITASLAKSLRVSNAETGERVAMVEGLSSMPWQMAGAPDGTRVAVSVGHAIEVHEVPTLRLVATWKVHRAVVSALSWTAAGLWSGAENGVAIRHADDGRAELSVSGCGEVRAIAAGGGIACISRAVARR